jgi:Patatin-like phospholipase
VGRRRTGDVGHRPKLVIVAVSGGAARSAYWTAVVLDRLERTLPSFGQRLRIISGASGGMLGAACYVNHRRAVAEECSAERDGAGTRGTGKEPASVLPAWIREDLPTRSLEPLARGIALAELWNTACPWTVPEDRGVILEKHWDILRYPFVELADLDAQGKVPSLIFSPMIVEDGRRLLISNLELGLNHEGWANSPIVEAASPQIKQDEGPVAVSPDGTAHRRYSLASLEYFRIFPGDAHRNLFLSTAVRMSASFPFVSPAVYLPTNPPRRVVDAGYYDNYGIQVATSWIRRNRDWLATCTSGVLLVQIRSCSSPGNFGKS